ncbi:MAG: radical SAM protein, partial [Thermodesulfovibrionia bacterium]|nr:radical SAM protein [Thermodesulfovibrionia bacterium]
IRLSSCNLRCSFCDTTYAYAEGEDIELNEIIDKVRSFGIGLVEITGGEPLLQEEVHNLMRRLLDEGYRILLETNGSMDISGVDSLVSVVLDIKTPSSKMADRMIMENLDRVEEKDDVKFVICTEDDYKWVKDVMQKRSLSERTNVLLSPAYGMLDPAELVKWMMKDRINARLNLQLHKYIFGPDKKGV